MTPFTIFNLTPTPLRPKLQKDMRKVLIPLESNSESFPTSLCNSYARDYNFPVLEYIGDLRTILVMAKVNPTSRHLYALSIYTLIVTVRLEAQEMETGPNNLTCPVSNPQLIY